MSDRFSFLQDIAARVIPGEHHALLSLALGGGKHVRPWLVLRTCEELEIDPQPLWDAITGIELLHAASLVHDDIVDHDLTRRGNPNLPARVGVEQSVLYGDYLFLAALELFSQKKYPPSFAQMAVRVVKEMTHAQLMETQGKVDREETYWKYAQGKTAELFGLCARIPLEFSGTTHASSVAFAKTYGLAFQVADDLSEEKEEVCLQRFIGKEAAQQKFQSLLEELKRLDFIPVEELPFIGVEHAFSTGVQ